MREIRFNICKMPKDCRAYCDWWGTDLFPNERTCNLSEDCCFKFVVTAKFSEPIKSDKNANNTKGEIT